MLNKHFFKTLILFTTFIAIGLFVVFTLGYLEEEGSNENLNSTIAK